MIEVSRRTVFKALSFLVGIAVPLAVYYVLRAAGAGVYLALLSGTLISAVPSLVTVVRRRSLGGGLSTYLTIMLFGSLVIGVLSGSTQFLLAKGAVLTGVTGVWFIASLWARRPLSYLFTRPLLEGRLHWSSDWDGLWDSAPRFRRVWRVSSVLWGVGTLLDAGLRVLMSYTLSPDQVPVLSTALYAATTVVLIVVTNVYYVLSGLHNPTSAMYRDVEYMDVERAPDARFAGLSSAGGW